MNALDAQFERHDYVYGVSPKLADQLLLSGMWGFQPGPFGQIYRLLITPVFEAKYNYFD